MEYVWIGLSVIATAALVWLLIIFGWAFLASRAIKAGAISWDEFGSEQAELRPLARPRRFRSRTRASK
jgi:hypothetical protein